MATVCQWAKRWGEVGRSKAAFKRSLEPRHGNPRLNFTPAAVISAWSRGSGRADTAAVQRCLRRFFISVNKSHHGQRCSWYFPLNAVHGAVKGISSTSGQKCCMRTCAWGLAKRDTRARWAAIRKKGIASATSPIPHNSTTSSRGRQSAEGDKRLCMEPLSCFSGRHGKPYNQCSTPNFTVYGGGCVMRRGRVRCISVFW